MYYLENKGIIKGLLIIKESEMVYKLCHSTDKALKFKTRYEANQYKKKNAICNNFRIIQL
jgi:hypothetical protein